ncbi:sulfate adenylyltransferase [Streptomyces reniochalinae]|uniref:Sulfate adenylyltransferase n=1 Tax=Streptomyces reniochalinae TaxID=2250578 RepID=A0A367EF75_9ACTN|nr:sulfate adenylyltransferase [Streptomyces reniochalinae]
MGAPGMSHEAFSTFDQTGGRIGSGARGSGQGGVGRCAR